MEVLIEVGKGVLGVVVGRDHELMGVAKYSNIYNNKLLLLIWRILIGLDVNWPLSGSAGWALLPTPVAQPVAK